MPKSKGRPTVIEVPHQGISQPLIGGGFDIT